MTTLAEYMNKRLAADPDFRARWEADRPAREAGEAVIAARVSAGLTQAQLAERIGTTQSAIARIESGSTLPKLVTLARIARAVDVCFEITPTVTLSAKVRRHRGGASGRTPAPRVEPAPSA